MSAYSSLAKSKTENQQSMASTIEKLTLKANSATVKTLEGVKDDVFAAMKVSACEFEREDSLNGGEFAISAIEFGEKPQK